MTEIKISIGTILIKISQNQEKKEKKSQTKLGKSRRDFISCLLVLFLQIKGRINFSQMSRYGDYNETTYHRHFKEKMDFLEFNKQLCLQTLGQERILIFDPSWLPKSGKKTPGKDKFWSGCSGQARWGLEIGGIAVGDVMNHTALHLEAIQTPKFSTLKSEDKTLIEHYTKIILDRKEDLTCLSNYLCVDAYFSKFKFIDAITKESSLHIISRLRDDACLFYLYQGVQKASGRKRIKGDKINPNNIDKERFTLAFEDHKKRIYSIKAYCRSLKRVIRLALVQFLDNTGEIVCYKLFFSTNTELEVTKLYSYYQLRFQIEFLYRDAKQFTGLTHCQSTNDQKMYNHFNMALTSVSVAKAEHWLSISPEQRGAFSMSDMKTMYHNQYLIDRFIDMFDIDTNLHENKNKILELSKCGLIAA